MNGVWSGMMRKAAGGPRGWAAGIGALGAALVVGGATGSGGVAAPVAGSWAMPAQEAPEVFPHAEHEGLFPLCTGCHEGVPTGDGSEYYPEAETCQGCHDGVELERVEYRPPEPGAEPDNLDFEHPTHADEVDAAGDPALDCSSCHARPGAPRMSVEPLEAEQCLSCHGHEAESHVEDAECTTCHVPLASTRLPTDRIASMTVPGDHVSGGFLREVHGRISMDEPARCATCHTQERCLTCHVDGADQPAVQAMPAAGPELELPPMAASYPVPESHRSEDFERLHGPLSEEESCSTCHTENDCASCHLEPLPRTASDLPRREAVVAPGVSLMEDAPASHADPYFMDDHPSMAAADPGECASCHTEAFCASCHDAPQEAEFHPPNYVAQHFADAWNQTAECATCHDVAAFCRSCHVESGLGGQGRLESGYHDAQPLWLLRHGQAARQSLETCASCHTQRQCLQCHSTIGAFQVSPHGSDFDARRAFERNPGICLACHIENPLGGTP